MNQRNLNNAGSKTKFPDFDGSLAEKKGAVERNHQDSAHNEDPSVLFAWRIIRDLRRVLPLDRKNVLSAIEFYSPDAVEMRLATIEKFVDPSRFQFYTSAYVFFTAVYDKIGVDQSGVAHALIPGKILLSYSLPDAMLDIVDKFFNYSVSISLHDTADSQNSLYHLAYCKLGRDYISYTSIPRTNESLTDSKE